MRIESGSTGERKARVGIFLVMCVMFSGWFAYDGLITYPRKNLDWARQAMVDAPTELQPNPRVKGEALRDLREGPIARGETPTLEALREQFGEPTYVQPGRLIYAGPQLSVTVVVDDGKVVTVKPPEKLSHPPDAPNYSVTPEKIERIKPGMSEAELTLELGSNATREPQKYWFVGPAGFLMAPVEGGKVVGKPDVQLSKEYSEGDIFVQKALSVILAFVSLGVGWMFLQALRLKVVLDDAGLTYNGRSIGWDQMQALDTARYLEKGWVDLVYDDGGTQRVQRIDSYHVARFKEIVAAICERKGFTLPTAQSASSAPREEHV